MARQQQDREDLLAEATALVERIELAFSPADQPLVVGVRRDGCLSVYFSPDDAYHFNSRHELRRAYHGGRLLKAEQQRLIALTRHRTDSEVQLLRHELSADEQQHLLADLQRRLGELRQAAEDRKAIVLRTVPDELPALDRVVQWLAPLSQLQIAAAPNVL